MKYKRILAVLLVLAAFTTEGSSVVADRKAYWEAKVHAEIPVGTSLADLQVWARRFAAHVPDTSNPKFMFELEAIPTKNLIVCNSYSILLEVEAKDGTVSSESLLTRGICL